MSQLVLVLLQLGPDGRFVQTTTGSPVILGGQQGIQIQTTAQGTGNQPANQIMVKKIDVSEAESSGQSIQATSQSIDTTVGGQMKPINNQNQIVYLGGNATIQNQDQSNTVTVAKKASYPPGTQGKTTFILAYVYNLKLATYCQKP